MPVASVLDSHAWVAYFRDEPGAEQVETRLTRAAEMDRPLHMTEVNYAEVKYILTRKDGSEAWEAAARILGGLPVEFHPADRELADLEAGIKACSRLSLARVFAAAPARKHRAELVTGDPEFKAVEKQIKINWLP